MGAARAALAARAPCAWTPHGPALTHHAQPVHGVRRARAAGTVLELPLPGLLETVYRCRLGAGGGGMLEKVVGEDAVRVPQPDGGCLFYRGQTVHVVRPSGLLELGTVARSHPSAERAPGGGGTAEPCYGVRIHPSEVSRGGNIESLLESDLRPPRPQAGCAFFAGQLVHASGADGTRTLCRVVEFVRVGYSLGYKVEVVPLG